MAMEETRPAIGEEFQPFDIADPFPFYRRARAEEPVFYSSDLDFWVVSRYQDVLPILRDPETFSSENAQRPYRPLPASVQEVLGQGLSGRSGLLARQPPDHTRLRAFVNRAFTPRRVAVLEPRVRELAVSMIESMAAKDRADWVAELAYDLPALVILILLGVPDSEVPRVKRWADSRVALNFGDCSESEQVEHARNVVAYWRYCEELVAARFARLGDDLPSDLVRVYQEGDRSLTTEEIAGLVFAQLTAGHETTSGLLATGLLELLRHREQWEAICRDRSVIPGAVEELLRVCSPVLAIKRRTKRPATVGGVAVPEGANVLLLLGSANHDSELCPAPEGVDVQAAGDGGGRGRHLAFGHGIHYCLGAPLARLEARVVLEELAARLPGVRLVEDQEIEFSRNTTFRAPTRLLLEWGAAAQP